LSTLELQGILLLSNNVKTLCFYDIVFRMDKKKRNPEGLRRSSTKGGGFGGVCPALAPNTKQLCPQNVMDSSLIAALQNTFYQSSIKYFCPVSGYS
jgi:hypothetical protein